MKPDPEQASSMGPVEDPPPEDNNLEISIKMQVRNHRNFENPEWKGLEMSKLKKLDIAMQKFSIHDYDSAFGSL